MSLMVRRSIGTIRGTVQKNFDFKLPEIIETTFFSSDTTCYAILDGARLKFLEERIISENLSAACLYDGDAALSEVAPWLVALSSQDKLMHSLFQHDPETEDPFALFDSDAAVFFRSCLSLSDLRSLLRKYTNLPDEIGTRHFLRLAQPGYFDAMLHACPNGADFFDEIEMHIYMLPTLQEGEREVWTVEPETGSISLGRLPVLDAQVRAAFRRLRNDLEARRLARDDGGEQSLRIRRHGVYFKAMQAGFDAPETLRRADNVLAQTPLQDHPTFWDAVAKGDWSLGYLCQKMAQRHNIDERV